MPHVSLGTVASAYHAAGGGGNPVNTVAPVLTYSSSGGDGTLTCTTGTWTGTTPITFTYYFLFQIFSGWTLALAISEAPFSPQSGPNAQMGFPVGDWQDSFAVCLVEANNGNAPNGFAISNESFIF